MSRRLPCPHSLARSLAPSGPTVKAQGEARNEQPWKPTEKCKLPQRGAWRHHLLAGVARLSACADHFLRHVAGRRDPFKLAGGDRLLHEGTHQVAVTCLGIGDGFRATDPDKVHRLRLPISAGFAAGAPASVDVSFDRSSPRVMLPMRVALALAPARVRWLPRPA